MPSHRHVVACLRRTSSVSRAGRTGAAVVAAGASLALLAGCASATDASGAAGAGAAAPAAVTSSAAAPSFAALAGRVAAAVGSATSVHVTSDTSGIAALPVKIGTVTADVALAAGRPSAADVTAGVFALRYVGGTAWVKLPGAAAATPWTLVSPDSSNPVIAMAATRLAAVRSGLAGIDPAALLKAATGLREVGPGDVGGTAATQYAFDVDPAAVATALGAGSAGGRVTGAVPVQLWLDGSDRPVRVTATPVVDGTKTPLTVTLSGWNALVSIAAPPAAQVTR